MLLFSINKSIKKLVYFAQFSAHANPSIMRYFPFFFYFDDDDDDANDLSVQRRNNFINLVSSRFVPPVFCNDKPLQCKKEKVVVYAGKAAGMSIHVSTVLIPIVESVIDK